MSEIGQVTITVAEASGRVAFGYYRLAEGVITMTDPRRLPVLDREGPRFTHKLAAGEDARVIAGRLTRQIMKTVAGTLGARASFAQDISYPKLGLY